MLCKDYAELTAVEKVKFIGELIHACQSSTPLYEIGVVLIETAKKDGVFNGVEILPNNSQDTSNT
jgi:hypothetical protein